MTASRRRFLQSAAAAGISLPFFVRTLRSAPPSETVRHASFGGSGMAAADYQQIAGLPNVRFVALAEVDLSRAEQAKKRYPEVKVYQDWREMLDKEEKNLDSVNVGTPDHMHAPMAMSALQRGLAVYCQKPLTHDVFESRRLAEVAREKRLASQMGIQVHSSPEYRMAVKLVQDGAIGKVTEVHTWSNKKWGDPNPRPESSDPVPAGFNWDAWVGVCAERPFIGKENYYHPGNWRKRLDFGTGTFGDMGCHIYDPVFKALALTAPLSVLSEGPQPNAYNWANDAIVHYLFPGTQFTAGKSVAVTWYDGDQRPPKDVVERIGKVEVPGQGSILLGTDGVMVLPHVSMPILLPEEKFKDFARPKLEPVSHWGQFIDAVRGKGQPSAGFDYSGPLTEAILLGGVASRFPKQKLEWDAAKLQFSNVPDANQFLRREYRKGWEVTGLSDV